jgi:hypothetical protein
MSVDTGSPSTVWIESVTSRGMKARVLPPTAIVSEPPIQATW